MCKERQLWGVKKKWFYSYAKTRHKLSSGRFKYALEWYTKKIDVFERKEMQINLFWINKEPKFGTRMWKFSRDLMP